MYRKSGPADKDIERIIKAPGNSRYSYEWNNHFDPTNGPPSAEDIDPFSQIKTGLPASMADLIQGLDPKMVERAMVGAVLAVKGWNYLSQKIQKIRQDWSYTNIPLENPPENPYGDYAKNAGYVPYTGTEEYSQAKLQEYMGYEHRPEAVEPLQISKSLLKFIEFQIQTQTDHHDLNAPTIVNDQLAKVLNDLGRAGLSNESLNHIKHWPEKNIQQLLEYFREPGDDGRFNKPNIVPMSHLYDRQTLGSFEAEIGEDYPESPDPGTGI